MILQKSYRSFVVGLGSILILARRILLSGLAVKMS